MNEKIYVLYEIFEKEIDYCIVKLKDLSLKRNNKI